MTEALSDRGKGYLLIGLTAVLFSTTEIALKALGDSFAPIQLTMERQLVGAAALGFLLFLRGDLRRIDLHGRNCLMILLISFIVGVVHMSLIQLALLTEDASAVAAILSGSPVFSFLFAHYILKEPLRLHHFLALAFQVAGILAILNPFSLEMSLRGFLLVLFGTLSFSLYGTLAKKNLSRFSSGQLAFLTLLFSSLELLLILLAGRTAAGAAFYRRIGLDFYVNVPLIPHLTLKSGLIFLYVAVVLAGGGQLLLTRIVEYTSAAESSFIYFLKPVISSALAFLLLHESISRNRILGLVFSAAASLLAIIPALLSRRKAQPDKEKPHGTAPS